MTTIVFEPHATTQDNEAKVASGHFDVALSKKGTSQAKDLGKRRADEHFDAIFTSDLQRAYKTALLAFGDKFPIIQDARLRECNYGKFEHRPKDIVEAARIEHIKVPFPGGESYVQRAKLMKSFLEEMQRDYPNSHVLIIGHRATHFGLDHWLLHKPLEVSVSEGWQWQPGWSFELPATKKL